MSKEPRPSELELAYRGVLNGNTQVLEDLLRFCGVWSPNLASDSLEMARNEGRRLVGLYILQMLGEIRTQKNLKEAS